MRKIKAVRLVAVALAAFASIRSSNPQDSFGASPRLPSRTAPDHGAIPRSAQYEQTQQRLARGWNTWDVHSVATQVLLPEGLAVHVGLKHNSTLDSDTFLGDVLIGRLEPGAERVTPGAHSWDGSYTELTIEWHGDRWRIRSASSEKELSIYVEPLPSASSAALPPTVVFWVDYLWNRSGSISREKDWIEARSSSGAIPIYCTCTGTNAEDNSIGVPIGGPYFAANLTGPVGISMGKRLDLAQINSAVTAAKEGYQGNIDRRGKNGEIYDAIETTLGWDTIYEPEKGRVISPVSRIWSIRWGGYVLFDWDTFFAATLAGIGDKDLAYANALEMLNEATPLGIVPNSARAGGWKSFDRSEPPVGAITVLGLYRQFHDRWFIQDTFEPLLKWNRWWAEHRDLDGYLTWGSDPENPPRNPDDRSVGAWQGAIYESGLDNSPMYDGTTYGPNHLVEYADVGLMSMYVADCDALSKIAAELGRDKEAKELTARAEKYRARLQTMWDPTVGMFLNRDLHAGHAVARLSPTNFYPLLARAATPEQAKTMIEKHLLNREEFWGEWVIPSIARDDPAFKDQSYWRGRIWGPMNFLVYLGLANYETADVRKDFASKSYALFLKEWKENGHVHENYNAVLGSGDDIATSDRFYHWGALLGYVEYLEQGTGVRH